MGNRGVIIAFEGIEGSGKTTQAHLLYEYLKERGLPCLLLREPGATAIGEKIREILLDPECKMMDAKTELLLYLASRAQMVAEKIIPGLREKKVIITDRFSDSSLAYQGGGRRLGLDVVSRLNKFATNKIRPDLVILLDLPVAIGLNRIRRENSDRLEREEEKFHEEVRKTYLQIAKRRGKRIKVFDATKEKEEIHWAIRSKVIEFLNQKGLI
ncbi:MAG: dTMP kinase [candidate division WOR-3 bacterium]